MNLAIDFSDDFKSTSSKTMKIDQVEPSDDNEKQQDTTSVEDMSAMDDSKWIIEQLHICNINISEEDLENSSVSTAIIGLLTEKSRVYAQNKTLIDENTKSRGQLNNATRDKEKTTEEIAILKQEARVAQGKVSAMQTEQRQLRNRWLEEKTDLENKVHQSLALQTHATATLRKKEKDYDKLQLQLSKLVKESNKSNKTMMVISKPLKANSTQKTQLEKAEIAAASLREAEINNLRTSMQTLEKTNELLQKNVLAVTASVTSQVEGAIVQCTEEFNMKIDEMRAEYEASIVELSNENTKTVASPLPLPLPPKVHSISTSTSATAMTPPPGSLVNTYLTNTPGAHAREVLNEVQSQSSPVPKMQMQMQTPADAAVLSQLTEALAVIKEQDRLIKQGTVHTIYILFV